MRTREQQRRDSENEAASLAGDLVRHLETLRGHHATLLDLVRERREALRFARGSQLGLCMARESELLQRIAETEASRQRIAMDLAAALDPQALSMRTPPNAEWLASRLPESLGEPLIESASALRAILEELRDENASAQQAAAALDTHMRGLIRAVEQRLSQSGAYSERGVVRAGAPVLTSMDITS